MNFRLTILFFTLIPVLCFGEQKIIVGGDYNYPPYSFINENGVEVGYDVDIIKAIMHEIDLDVEFKFDHWDSTLLRLSNGQIDVIASIVYSASREKQYDFTFPLHTEYYAIFALEDTEIIDVNDLESKRPAYLEGDISNESFLEPMHLLHDSVPVNSLPEAFNKIIAGDCDYVVAPYPLGMLVINENKLRSIEAKGPKIIPSIYCLAVKQGNSYLLSQLNLGIEKLSRNGELDRIYSKWVKYKRIEDKYQSWFTYTIYILIILAFIVIILLLFWYSLRKQVRKKTKQIKDAEEVYQKVFNSVDDALLIITKDGIVADANLKALEIYGLDYDKIINSSFLEIVSDDNRDLVSNLIESMGNEFVPFKGEVKKIVNGKTIHINSKGLRISLDKEDRYLTVLHDITDEKMSFLKLTEAKRIAEEANNAKSTFLSTISHEVRTPLNAIIGYSNLLKKTDLNSKQADYNNKVDISSKLLLDLVNDILDITKIEAKKIEINAEPINIRKLIGEIYKLQKFRVKEKGLDFNLNISQEIPEYVIGDELRLSQILLNVLSNAVKFTDAGFISLKVNLEGSESGNSVRILFSIKDTGIGILFDKQEMLFKPFEQVQNSQSRKYGGTGLGLAISKQLVSLMGGEIMIESDLGKGSILNISIPFNKIKGECSQKRPDISIDNITIDDCKILLVEDNMFNAEILIEQLNEFKADVTHVNSGIKALELLEHNVFDIILMDIEMSELNGFETTQKILENKLSNAPIIALSAHALDYDKAKAKAMGMADYLNKPVGIEKLISTLRKHSQKTASFRHENIFLPNNGLAFFGGDMVMYKRSLERFSKNFSSQPNELINLFSNDKKELINNFHILKSATKMIGADAISKKAAFLETEFKNASEIATIERVKEFSYLLQSLLTAISSYE